MKKCEVTQHYLYRDSLILNKCGICMEISSKFETYFLIEKLNVHKTLNAQNLLSKSPKGSWL